MITLRDDTLSIAFPEIAGQVRSIVERQIQKVAAELPPTWSRADLVAEIESSRNLPKLSPAEQETARTKVRTWTPAHVEGWLREFALNSGGLSTDAFTALSEKVGPRKLSRAALRLLAVARQHPEALHAAQVDPPPLAQ